MTLMISDFVNARVQRWREGRKGQAQEQFFEVTFRERLITEEEASGKSVRGALIFPLTQTKHTQIDTYICSSISLLLSACISVMPSYHKTLSRGQSRHEKPCCLYNHINSLAGMRKPCLSHSLSCLGRVCNILK